MWLTRVKDSIRLISDCAMAPRMPTTIVASAAHSSSPVRWLSGNSTVWVRMIA